MKRYVAAHQWQRLHVVAAANAARLLESVGSDLVGAAAAYECCGCGGTRECCGGPRCCRAGRPGLRLLLSS